MLTTLGGRAIQRRLDCTSDRALVSSYRTRFFLRVALAQSVTLLAFVGVFMGAPIWIYALAGLFALWQFAREGPTRRGLERDQKELDADCCRRSLITVLTNPTPTEQDLASE